MYLVLKQPKLKQLNPLDFRLCLLNIKDIEERKCKINSIKENANIIRDPLQQDIISAFGINKSKNNKLYNDNINLNFCEQISMNNTQRHIFTKYDEKFCTNIPIDKPLFPVVDLFNLIPYVGGLRHRTIHFFIKLSKFSLSNHRTLKCYKKNNKLFN